MENMKLISYNIEYEDYLHKPNILAIFRLNESKYINKFNCDFFTIRMYNFNNIEFAFFEEYWEINNYADKSRFQIGIADNSEWYDYYTINDQLNDLGDLITDINFINNLINRIQHYINKVINLYKEYLL